MQTRTSVLFLVAALAAVCSAAARPLDSSSDWPLEALAAIEASCDGCFDPVAAIEAGVAARSDRLDPSLLDSQRSHGSVHDDRRGGSREEQAQRFMLLTNLEVPPSIRSVFERQWRLAKKRWQLTQGLVVAKLQRSLSHNKHFYIYEEWESEDAFMKHLKEDPGQRMFEGWCEENDITVQPVRLSRIAVYIAKDQPSVRRKGEDTPPADIIRFTIKPSQMEDFKSAAKELTEAVAQQEEDNLVLSFATATDSDYIAYVYAQWKTREGIAKHLGAQHTLRFLDRIKKMDILAKRSWWMPVDEWLPS